jgi:type IV secretion system protein VirD4
VERAVLGGLVAGAVVAALVLGTGHISALVFGGGWPRYEASEIPDVLWRFAGSPGDPAAAWAPINRGAQIPGPVVWWLTFAVVASTLIWPGIAVTRASHRRRGTVSSEWARARDLRCLRMRWGERGRLVIGTTGWRRVAVESRHSLLVLGPTQSGKTTGLAIPAILEWPGPVVATSVKGDLVDDTIGWRCQLGDVHVFDPGGVTRYRPSGWSPLAGCGTWDGATRSAWDLAMAGKAAVGGGMNLADFWFSSAAKSLAPLLLAAAHSDRSMGDVARWIDREERDEVLDVLHGLEPDASLAHKAMFRREERARSSLFQVMQQVVGVYLDPQVAASAETNDIVPAELLDGELHTLYITAPHHDQARLRPLFATLVRQILTAVYDHASTGEPLRAPLLVVLDEAANIAPVEDLPTVASTAAAMGLQLVTVFQDLAQIRGRYGDAAGTVVNNHRAKLVLPGVSDLDTLELASVLAGDQETDRDSVTTDLSGRRSSTTATHWRRLLPPEAARQQRDGHGVLLYGNLAPVRVLLRPWHRNRELRRRAHHPLDPLPARTSRRAAASPAPSRSVAVSQPPLPLPPNVSALDAARARLRPPPDPGGEA